MATLDTLMTEKLHEAIVAQHFERGEGIHGVEHWLRVEANGLMLGERLGADLEIISLFAWFHDAARMDNFEDPFHGKRGAALARRFNDEYMGLSPERLELLCVACEGHTYGRTHDDPTVCCCWDGDRLDLVRLGYWIDPQRLATQLAGTPEMLDAAWKRFMGR